MADESLSRRQNAVILAALAVVVIAFGSITVHRAAFQNTRKGDQEVYFRSANAILNGEDLYDVTDSHGWHYAYPPLFAILLTPLAGPVPFALGVALWYAVSVALLAVAIHWLACLVDDNAGRGGRRWWALRLLPVLICLPPLGHSLMRGQVNLLVLFLLTGMIAATVHRRSMRAGAWLAAAICIKIIPAWLLIAPIWRRDGRFVVGCAAGLLVGLLLVPAAVFGPTGTLDCYTAFADRVLLPGVGHGVDGSRQQELTAMTGTHSQSFLAAIHATARLGRKEVHATPAEHLAHWTLAGLFVAGTLWAARGQTGLLPGSCFVALMPLCSPVCHTHYFTLALPLVVALLAVWREGDLPRAGTALLAVFTLVQWLLVLPGLELLRDLGIGLYLTLGLIVVGWVVMSRRKDVAVTIVSRRFAETSRYLRSA